MKEDGEGFDPGAVGKVTRSWGVELQSLRERAEMLGGSLLIYSGAGTRVALRVPFDGRS